MTESSLQDDQRQALARTIRTGAILFPLFYVLDVFAALTLYPEASLGRLALYRAIATALL